jgi:hypothetical protein
MQTKTMSAIEAVTNTAVGLVISFAATAAICRVYDIPMTHQANAILTFWMTVLSIGRSYVMRRVFNKRGAK